MLLGHLWPKAVTALGVVTLCLLRAGCILGLLHMAWLGHTLWYIATSAVCYNPLKGIWHPLQIINKLWYTGLGAREIVQHSAARLSRRLQVCPLAMIIHV